MGYNGSSHDREIRQSSTGSDLLLKLDTAADDAEYPFFGYNLLVDPASDGVAVGMVVSDVANYRTSFFAGARVYDQFFKKVVLTWPAQPGKQLRLVASESAVFTAQRQSVMSAFGSGVISETFETTFVAASGVNSYACTFQAPHATEPKRYSYFYDVSGFAQYSVPVADAMPSLLNFRVSITNSGGLQYGLDHVSQFSYIDGANAKIGVSLRSPFLIPAGRGTVTMLVNNPSANPRTVTVSTVCRLMI